MARRAFDIVVAATGLVLLSPALALAAIAIRLETPGAVICCDWENHITKGSIT